jgi:hypothetical protein
LDRYRIFPRCAQRLGLFVGSFALALAGMMAGNTRALAEFEIQESGIEKGEVELEYRGAVHDGFPKTEREDAGDDEDEGAAEEEEEGEFLRQSHDFEIEYGLTERFLISGTLSADEPLDGDFNLSGVELEAQYEFIEREGNGLGLAFQSGYTFATRGGEADELEFGPIVELAAGKALLTLNPIFGAQVGDNRQTDSLGFEYGWRGEYDFAKHWGVGVEMFGEIEDLANAGSFDDQNHSIGPTVFYNPEGVDDDGNGGGDDDGDDNKKVGGPAEMEFSLNVGVQFGLTDVTSDTALKFQGRLEF